MSSSAMIRLSDFERNAKLTLPKQSWDFYNMSSEDGFSCEDNSKAFKRYRLKPRMLRDMRGLDCSTTVLGHRIPAPICVAPTAAHSRAHGSAELGTSKGVAEFGTIYAMSSFATRTLEDVADAAPEGLRFFNMYLVTNRDLLVELVRRAEKKGFLALMITIDSPTAGPAAGRKRLEIYRQTTERLPYSYCNLMRESKQTLSDADKISYAMSLINPSCTWDTVKWLCSITRLPIILKGVLSGEEAERAVEAGASGIIVSNHGGRQLDTTPATIDVLGEVVEAVRGRCEVYIDGGVRTGTDVLKALALGARAVFIGRPVIYALACKGSAGVNEMLCILRDEFRAAMALCGCRTVADINKGIIKHKTEFLQDSNYDI